MQTWSLTASGLQLGDLQSIFSLLGDSATDDAATTTSALANLIARLTFIAKIALGLGFVIFIHELGHFLAAKTFGVRCDKFYVGFDVPIRIGPIHLPRTLGKFKWGETEYGIGIIPLGGYVKMLGQDDDPRNAQAEAEKIRQEGGAEAPLDPRSYPAKPVWQRMIIISAGVVMNLISAVFLAAAAYYQGVQYTPSIVGQLNAGSPAWLAGLEPGDRVLKTGSSGDDNPNLRHPDMVTSVLFHGFKNSGKPLDLRVQRGDEQLTLHPIPTPRYDPKGEHHFLGFAIDKTTQIAVKSGSDLPIFETLNSELGRLAEGDRIVAVDGKPLPVNPHFGHPVASDLRRILQAKWNQSAVLTIERTKPGSKKTETSKESFDVTLPAVPRTTLGIGFEIGAITAVRPGSVGESAGFQVGDQIISVDGEPIPDSLRLPEVFATKAGKDVRFSILRRSAAGQSTDKKDENTVELTVQSPATPQFDAISMTGSAELSLGGIGVAFDVTPTVAFVDSTLIQDGQVQVGDRLLQYRWVLTDDEYKLAKTKFNVKQLTNSQTIDKYYNVVSFDLILQAVPVGSKFECYFERAGKTINSNLTTHLTSDSYQTDERGLALSSLSDIHKTNHLSEALSLGFWETKRRFFEVLSFLKLLVTGQIGFGGVAGPVKLAEFAAHEAGFGTSRLLLFLTMLSANLAILNFLPIPALDGGHMMFLTAEAIRGKPVSEELQIKLTMAGVLGLLTLMAFVILKDLYSYVS